MLAFQITARNSNEDRAEHQAYPLLWQELLLQLNPKTEIWVPTAVYSFAFPNWVCPEEKKKIIFPDSLVTIFFPPYFF